MTRSLLLLSAQAGSGRSTLACNLGAWLGRDREAWLLERAAPGASEAGLHLDAPPLDSADALAKRGPGLRHVLVQEPAQRRPCWPGCGGATPGP